MEWIERPKIGFKQKLGNCICGFLKIIDGLIIVLTLGNLYTYFSLKFTVARRRNNWLIDWQEEKKVDINQ